MRPTAVLTVALVVVVILPAVGGVLSDEEAARSAAIVAITRGDHITALARLQEALRLSRSPGALTAHARTTSRGWYVRLQMAQILGALGRHAEALVEYKSVAKSTHIPARLLAAGA